MSRAKIFLTAVIVLAGIAAALAWREYAQLRRIQKALKTPAGRIQPREPVPEEQTAEKEAVKMVYGVKRSGASVSARARFGAFKKAVEAQPELLRRWGTLGWKILDDTPALCIRHLGEGTPFAPLGVVSGDCITHIDGETVNQPMRNLGIWLTLPARSSIHIDTLRGGRRISYHLTKG